MEDSSKFIILLVILFGCIVSLIVLAYDEGKIDIYFSLITTILAFGLGTIATWLNDALKDEHEREMILNDLLTETEEIPKLANIETGPLYSSTWFSVKANGIPPGIQFDLRRLLADVFLLMEMFNEKVRRYEEYSIRDKPKDETQKVLLADAEQARSDLILAANATMKKANELDIQWKKEN
ncbi:MAG: hypothetical protein ACTSUO_05600 [Candidatus Thorarchaeota archaeon]